MLSVPGSTPSSCIRSAHISAPTTDAALFRVTVESRTPNAAIPASGERVDREAREEQERARARRETFVPESDVSGWKPQATLPATRPTRPIANTSAIV